MKNVLGEKLEKKKYMFLYTVSLSTFKITEQKEFFTSCDLNSRNLVEVTVNMSELLCQAYVSHFTTCSNIFPLHMN